MQDSLHPTEYMQIRIIFHHTRFQSITKFSWSVSDCIENTFKTTASNPIAYILHEIVMRATLLLTERLSYN